MINEKRVCKFIIYLSSIFICLVLIIGILFDKGIFVLLPFYIIPFSMFTILYLVYLRSDDNE